MYQSIIYKCPNDSDGDETTHNIVSASLDNIRTIHQQALKIIAPLTAWKHDHQTQTDYVHLGDFTYVAHLNRE